MVLSRWPRPLLQSSRRERMGELITPSVRTADESAGSAISVGHRRAPLRRPRPDSSPVASRWPQSLSLSLSTCGYSARVHSLFCVARSFSRRLAMRLHFHCRTGCCMQPLLSLRRATSPCIQICSLFVEARSSRVSSSILFTHKHTLQKISTIVRPRTCAGRLRPEMSIGSAWLATG